MAKKKKSNRSQRRSAAAQNRENPAAKHRKNRADAWRAGTAAANSALLEVPGMSNAWRQFYAAIANGVGREWGSNKGK